MGRQGDLLDFFQVRHWIPDDVPPLGQTPTARFACEAQGVSPPGGTLRGTCTACLSETSRGFPVDFPPTFTSWGMLQEVSRPVLCRFCHHVGHERAYRASCWLAAPGSFSFLKLDGVRELFPGLPDPPFALYTTHGWKKHGWLRVVVNTGRQSVWLTEDYNQWLVRRDDLERLCSLVLHASEYVGKKAWLDGTHRVEDEGRMALEEPDLYGWWRQQRQRDLVRCLVRIVVPPREPRRPE